MEYHRKQAKALVRAYRADDGDAIERAEAILGERAQARFLLSDAQYVIAREEGHRSWPELRRAHSGLPPSIEGEDVVVPTELEYGPDQPVEVVVRKRGWRFDLSDGGAGCRAGRPPDRLARHRRARRWWGALLAERQPTRRHLRPVHRRASRLTRPPAGRMLDRAVRGATRARLGLGSP